MVSAEIVRKIREACPENCDKCGISSNSLAYGLWGFCDKDTLMPVYYCSKCGLENYHKLDAISLCPQYREKEPANG